MRHVLRILGTRGVPAAHGGFETFAEQLALYLVSRGWRVVVYCQDDGVGQIVEDSWCGVHRVRIPINLSGPKGTVLFDWKATRHAARTREACLTLGYNTASFCAMLRLAGVPNVINMDGIEWKRAKWGGAAKVWFWLNDYAGRWLGDALVADHPEIARHLSTTVSTNKITIIPYGADKLENLDDSPVRTLGLVPGRYLTLVARAEPENSILEVVRGFSQRPRGEKLVVLGTYALDNPYHQEVRASASDEVVFPGAIYDKPLLHALRYHSTAYVHGHQVGGTNPSLVEALGAGNAVIAHDNRFNRWVAGGAARYFSDADSFSGVLDSLLADGPALRQLRFIARKRHESAFTWPAVMQAYEVLLEKYQSLELAKTPRKA